MKLAALAILLLAGCGGGGTSTPAPDPAPVAVAPVVASEVWTRNPDPVLVPSQPWEFSPFAKRGSVYEPAILFDQATGQYTMWYGGGWENSAIGVATSSDAIHWTKRADNPLIGQGKFTSVMVARVNVMRDAGQVYVYFATSINGVGAIFVTHSSDGVTNLSTPVPFIIPGPNTKNPNNSWLVRRDDGKWLAFFDSIQDTSVNVWETFSAVCDSLTGPCTVTPGAIKGLQVGHGAYGSGWAEVSGGKMETYYLAGPTGNLPTFIYHAETSAGQTTILNSGKPVLDILPGMDQVGDPFVVDVGSQRRMYVSDLDNRQGYSQIDMAVRQ